MATRPPSSPSMSQMSHSGRPRSSGHDINRAQRSSSWASSPGSGSAAWCTCVGDVEVGVVHPHRGRLADQGETDALAQLRHEVQPALHLGPDLVEPQAPTGVVQRTTLEDPDGAHVHGCVIRLHGEERRIERRQDVAVRGHGERRRSGGCAEQTSANPSSMQPASFGLSGTAATSAVMVMQARSPAEIRETLSAAPDGGDTA